MNLNVYIAKSGYCSRRKADLLIKSGQVCVNGKTATEPWRRVTDGDSVSVSGRPLATEEHVYVIFNKPYGVTSTVEDKYALKKVVDMVPKDKGRLYPVGRLDKMSRGLMILTNDGDFCNKVTHPRYEIEKEYIVVVRGAVDNALVDKMRRGVHDCGDLLQVKRAAIRSTDDKKSVLQVIVSEGKKRHIRRLFLKLGFSVLDLRRVRIGSLQLDTLKEGEYRLVDRDVIYRKALKNE